ncbi:MAG: hypothetical protein ACO2PO_23585 [Candidatus Calescibacterium sp.]
MLGKIKEMAKKIFGRKKELQERMDKFIQEYRQLVEKYNLDFAVRLKVTNLGIFPEIYIIERKNDKSTGHTISQQTS